jgi:hypothetical protein
VTVGGTTVGSILIDEMIKTLSISIAFVRKNPHLGLSGLLCVVGVLALFANIPALAGALFVAGASLLGAWITETNNRRSSLEDKARREIEARRFLAAELNRVIERVLYIHERASVNFVCAWSDDGIKPNDVQEDFIPYMPVLYPKAPQFKDLSGDDAMALILFYDSLHALDKNVNDWWQREGQLPANVFGYFTSLASTSLALAKDCIERFELEKLFPLKHESLATLSARIDRSQENHAKASEHCVAKFNTQKNSLAKAYPAKGRQAKE